MSKEKMEPIFWDRMWAGYHNHQGAAFLTGVGTTFLGFFFVDTVLDIAADSLFAAIGVVLMYVLLILHFSGMLLSKVPYINERVVKIVATLFLSGMDDEHVDRTLITVRSLGEKHGLQVVGDMTLAPEDIPPELHHLKHRVLGLRGTIHKMKAFNVEADAYLGTQGVQIHKGGEALDEMKEDE